LTASKNRTDPGEPANGDIYKNNGGIPQVPASLEESLAALETDREYLLAGGVFGTSLIDCWISFKKNECDFCRLKPTPAEFELYYGI
jgi:Glutamine synthetase